MPLPLRLLGPVTETHYHDFLRQGLSQLYLEMPKVPNH
eukprot:Gb_13686 [translate_table: standard]